MDDEWRQHAVGVRLDTRGFAADVEAMRASLEGPLATGADRAGRAIEGSLLRAVRNGRLGMDDLRKAALGTLDAIAAVALKAGVASVAHGGLGQALAGVLAGGPPGRATGGPVAAGRPYLVGERGPELFVPTAAGRVEPSATAAPREVRVTITVNAAGNAAAGESAAMLQRSSRQVARAVRAALSE